jgi:Zn finger protein HypA/HybF involved in hydrogenase expression
MTSIYDKIGKDELQKIINNSSSIRQVIEKVGLSSNGSGGYVTFKKKVIELNLDLSIFSENMKKHRKNIMNKIRTTNLKLEDVLIENSNYGRCHLKKRLLEEGILKNICGVCNLLPAWNGKALTLQLHHINGVNDDNRIDNLILVCPNCHSQLRIKKTKEKNIKQIKKEIMRQEKVNKKEEKNKKLIDLILTSNIDFTKLGWVKEVSKLTGIKHQKVNYWMKTNMPIFYKDVYKRKSNNII